MRKAKAEGDTNKARIINQVNFHNDGIIHLNDINSYAYQRFSEGQMLYFDSNHGLYIVTDSNWTKLN